MTKVKVSPFLIFAAATFRPCFSCSPEGDNKWSLRTHKTQGENTVATWYTFLIYYIYVALRIFKVYLLPLWAAVATISSQNVVDFAHILLLRQVRVYHTTTIHNIFAACAAWCADVVLHVAGWASAHPADCWRIACPARAGPWNVAYGCMRMPKNLTITSQANCRYHMRDPG